MSRTAKYLMISFIPYLICSFPVMKPHLFCRHVGPLPVSIEPLPYLATSLPLLAEVDLAAVFQKASSRAFDGGVAGASASAVQVVSLMWLRTSMNYQYKYGSSLTASLKTLYKEGGIPRLYQARFIALV